jgi:quercetin dioxygenase-like cupin family protein
MTGRNVASPTTLAGTAAVILTWAWSERRQIMITKMGGVTWGGGKLSLVEHPLAPRALGSPMHTHSHEDEYSYILAGQIGAQVGEEVIMAGPGEVIAKPSGIPHAFWNAGNEPARVLEIIAPGGFEDYFAALGDLLATGAPARPGRTAGPGRTVRARP